MKTADLYIRVSTDEQADKGYSQRSQEEHLIKYCETNGIRIGEIIHEDHSAKHFSGQLGKDICEKFEEKNVTYCFS